MKYIQYHLLSVLVISVVVGLVVYPISHCFQHNPFWYQLLIILPLFLLILKNIFFTKLALYNDMVMIKVLLIFAMIPLLFWLVDELYDFQRFLDEIGYQTQYLQSNMKQDAIRFAAGYSRSIYLFVLVGTIISAVVFPFKLLISIWVKYNKNISV